MVSSHVNLAQQGVRAGVRVATLPARLGAKAALVLPRMGLQAAGLTVDATRTGWDVAREVAAGTQAVNQALVGGIIDTKQTAMQGLPGAVRSKFDVVQWTVESVMALNKVLARILFAW